MKIIRALAAMVPLLLLCGCTGGGGDGPASFATAAWEKFRHDLSNSGQGNGLVADNNGQLKWQTQIDETPLSSSPAIGLDGTVYVGTEGGTLAALDATNGSIKWTVCSCDAPGSSTPLTCPAGTQRSLGALIASPAIHAFNARTNIFIGSASGALYAFQDDGANRTCTLRFQPAAADFGNDATITARFISSPTFVTNTITAAVAGIFVGAAIDVTTGDSTRSVGKLYALNTDGSLIWQFPRVGAADIGAVTASVAVGPVSVLYFTSADGNLYAVANDGTFKWTFPVGTIADASAPFAASPLTATLVYAATAEGEIFAVNPDGTFRWRVSSPDGAGFVSSLAAGFAAPTITPTDTPTVAPTPTPPPAVTATPSPTPTFALAVQTIFGITTSGTLVLIDSATGDPMALTGPAPVIAGPVFSSPALSSDSYFVVGARDGMLHAVNTSTGAEPSGWPVLLAAGVSIRSSPAISNDGVIYVGADNGIVYAVGTQ